MAWPLHALTLTTPDLALRGTDETDARALTDVFPDDVPHDPRLQVLTGDHRVLLKYWQSGAQWRLDSWNLWFTVRHGDRVIGAQGLRSKDFPVMRAVETWSWLVPGSRGRGFGRQMRAAVLHLAFEHLGAVRASSSAWEDNAASLAVSRALGYVDNGVDLQVRHPGDGVELASPGRMQRLILEAAGWRSPVPVSADGVEPCLPLFGVSRGGQPELPI